MQRKRCKKRRPPFANDPLLGHVYWLAEKLTMPAKEVLQRIDTDEMAKWLGWTRYKAALEKAAAAKATAERDMKRKQQGAPPVLVAGKRYKRRER